MEREKRATYCCCKWKNYETGRSEEREQKETES